MGINEAKKKIVIDNYFKNTCDVNTSIKEAFTKGFEVGLTKAVFPKDQYEARLKADMVAMLDKMRAEIEQLPTKTRINWDGCCPDIDYPEIEYVDVTKNKLLSIIDKYEAESVKRINET